MTIKTQQPKTYGISKSTSKREIYSNTILPQETRKISNNQPNLTPKAIREGRTKNPQSRQKERNHKEIENLNRLITSKEIETVIKKKNSMLKFQDQTRWLYR